MIGHLVERKEKRIGPVAQKLLAFVVSEAADDPRKVGVNNCKRRWCPTRATSRRTGIEIRAPRPGALEPTRVRRVGKRKGVLAQASPWGSLAQAEGSGVVSRDDLFDQSDTDTCFKHSPAKIPVSGSFTIQDLGLYSKNRSAVG